VVFESILIESPPVMAIAPLIAAALIGGVATLAATGAKIASDWVGGVYDDPKTPPLQKPAMVKKSTPDPLKDAAVSRVAQHTAPAQIENVGRPITLARADAADRTRQRLSAPRQQTISRPQSLVR